jgi:hypothetical protein
MEPIDHSQKRSQLRNTADQQKKGAYGAWLTSAERETARRTSSKGQWLSGTVFIVSVLVASLSIDRNTSGDYSVHLSQLIPAGVAVCVSTGFFLYFWLGYSYTKAQYIATWRRDKIYEAIEQIDETETVKQLIVLNQRRMDQYHDMTLSQAADAWRSSQFAMFVGLVVLGGGVVVALVEASSTASQAVVGGLTAIGAALSGYVAGTFLKARQQSLDQLNHYFVQPLTTGYLLTAERLANKVNGTTSDSMWTAMTNEIVLRAFEAQIVAFGGNPAQAVGASGQSLQSPDSAGSKT